MSEPTPAKQDSRQAIQKIFHAWYAGAISNSKHYITRDDFELYLHRYHKEITPVLDDRFMLELVQSFHRDNNA